MASSLNYVSPRMSTRKVVKKVSSSIVQQSFNNSTMAAYATETAKLLCSNDKVTVRDLWQEDPIVDIFLTHLLKLNIDELRNDTDTRLEQLKD